jgi:hypothetical protein
MPGLGRGQARLQHKDDIFSHTCFAIEFSSVFVLPLTFHKHHNRLPARLAEAVVAGASVGATVLPVQQPVVNFWQKLNKKTTVNVSLHFQ